VALKYSFLAIPHMDFPVLPVYLAITVCFTVQRQEGGWCFSRFSGDVISIALSESVAGVAPYTFPPESSQIAAAESYEGAMYE
jgi:hypothetical protein